MAKQSKKVSTPLPKLRPEYFEEDSNTIIRSRSDGLYESREDELIETSTPPPPSDAPDFQAEIDLLRKLLNSRGERGEDSDIVHAYSGIASLNFASATPILATFNALVAGTSPGQRVTNAIACHSGTFRFRFQYVSTSNATANTVAPPSIRIVVYREKVPNAVPPTAANAIEWTSGVPTSSNVFLTSFGASNTTNANGSMTAFRSPITFDNFHIYHDRVHTFKPMVTPIVTAAVTAGWNQFGAITESFHIPFHGAKTTYAGTLGTSITTNGLSYIILSDTPTALGPINAEISLDFVYSQASES